jgi:Tfp pilus assembly PilM family ATPase
MLDQREILLAALSLQQTGGVRVQVFEHLHAPQDLPDLLARDDWLVQTLRGLGAHLPARLRTMALAIGEDRCRQGVLEGEALQDAHRLPAEVQLEAAQAWGVGPDAVGFDFRIDASHAEQGLRVHWAACLREELQQWRQHARSAGWRLPVVEPEHQAAQRAAVCLGAQTLQHWADSPQDWQFSRTPVRDASEVDWPRLQAGPMWKPLVACGAALGALT